MDKKEELIYQMNKYVANLHIFKTIVHNYHWNLVGEHFFVIHPMLDGIMSETDTHIDAIAERILMIGGRPFASLKIYLEHGMLEEIDSKPYDAVCAVKGILENFKLLLDELNVTIRLAEDVDDQETLAILTDIGSLYQKHIWMYSAWLAK